MGAIYGWFSRLNDRTGVNFSIVYDAFDRHRFVAGLLMTLWLSAVSIALSLVLGVLGAWLQGARTGAARRLANGYVSAFRNTPPLIQLYFFYFGLGTVLPRLLGAGDRTVVGATTWAVVALGLGAGAMNVEIFRSGIEAVPRTTLEAAEALGYGRLAAYRHVVLPLAVRVCLPALTNNLVNLVKTTTLAYAIAVPELLYVSAQIWSDQLNVREMMAVLLVAYLLIVGAVVLVMGWVERALRIPGFGR
jgi:polar amino acid transport system permease protein